MDIKMKKILTTTASVIQLTSGPEALLIWDMLESRSPRESIDILVEEFLKKSTVQEERYSETFREALQKHRDNDPDRSWSALAHNVEDFLANAQEFSPPLLEWLNRIPNVVLAKNGTKAVGEFCARERYAQCSFCWRGVKLEGKAKRPVCTHHNDSRSAETRRLFRLKSEINSVRCTLQNQMSEEMSALRRSGATDITLETWLERAVSILPNLGKLLKMNFSPENAWGKLEGKGPYDWISLPYSALTYEAIFRVDGQHPHGGYRTK